MLLFAYASVSEILPICSLAPTESGERDSTAARLLLDRLICEAREAGVSLPEPLPAIEQSELGKPRFADRCAEFSLSHDGGAVLAVLSVEPDGTRARRVGADLVDLERPLPRADAVAARFFTEAERACLPNEGEGEDESEARRVAVLRRWAAKEAAVKLTGEGGAAIARTDTSSDRVYPLNSLDGTRDPSRARFEGDVTVGGRRFFVAIQVE